MLGTETLERILSHCNTQASSLLRHQVSPWQTDRCLAYMGRWKRNDKALLPLWRDLSRRRGASQKVRIVTHQQWKSDASMMKIDAYWGVRRDKALAFGSPLLTEIEP